jgi:hypothetical protein
MNKKYQPEADHITCVLQAKAIISYEKLEKFLFQKIEDQMYEIDSNGMYEILKSVCVEKHRTGNNCLLLVFLNFFFLISFKFVFSFLQVTKRLACVSSALSISCSSITCH